MGLTTQAMIFSRKYRIELKNEYNVYKSSHWDVHMNYKLNNYIYYRYF